MRVPCKVLDEADKPKRLSSRHLGPFTAARFVGSPGLPGRMAGISGRLGPPPANGRERDRARGLLPAFLRCLRLTVPRPTARPKVASVLVLVDASVRDASVLAPHVLDPRSPECVPRLPPTAPDPLLTGPVPRRSMRSLREATRRSIQTRRRSPRAYAHATGPVDGLSAARAVGHGKAPRRARSELAATPAIA